MKQSCSPKCGALAGEEDLLIGDCCCQEGNWNHSPTEKRSRAEPNLLEQEEGGNICQDLEQFCKHFPTGKGMEKEKEEKERGKGKKEKDYLNPFSKYFLQDRIPTNFGHSTLPAHSCPNSAHTGLAPLAFPVQNLPAHLRSLSRFNPNRPGIPCICLFHRAILLGRYFSDYLHFLYFFLQLYSSSFFFQENK